MSSVAAAEILHRRGARQAIHPIDVHRAGAADALAAGAAEGQRRIDVVFDPDERVEHHRPAVVAVHVVGVDARVLPVFRIPTIDAKFGFVTRLRLRPVRPGLALRDLGILRQREFDHDGEP
jgi:hypothetical protein